MNEKLHSKAISAAARCIEQKGYEVASTRWTGASGASVDIAAWDGATLVLIAVGACEADGEAFDESQVTRESMELAAISYLAEVDPPDGTPVRFDTIVLTVLDGTRALLRHHIAAMPADL